jgi:DnaJ-class molecular chaperone
VTLFLLASVSLTVWVAVLYLRPFSACPRCHGCRVVIHGSQKRASTCPRCKGAGRRQRPGSRTVHQLARRVRRYRARQRRDRARTATPTTFEE